jgi:hypothetical protein
MDGTPDMVALTLQSKLKERNLDVTVSTQGDEVVLASKTAGGLKFALILKPVRSESGAQQTRVSLQWLSNSDNQIHVQVMADLDKQGAKK